MASEPLDARGVAIAPGDTALYGVGNGDGGVHMAEAVVLGKHGPGSYDVPGEGEKVSLTPSGRVRLRVVRRSGFYGGEKPVVDVAPDRLVVLKPDVVRIEGPFRLAAPYLPPSPLPTQAEANRQQIENLIEQYTADLRATEVPDRWYYEKWDLTRFHTYAAEQLARLRKELRELDG